MAFNNQALYGKNVRRVFSGKDASIFDENGTLLTSIESYNLRLNLATAQYQPLGSPIQQAFLTGYSATLTLTEYVIEDVKLLSGLIEFCHVGRHAPMWTFQSVLHGYGKSDSRIIVRDCVPEGDIDLHNITIGDIVRRAWNFHVNLPPELAKMLFFDD